MNELKTIQVSLFTRSSKLKAVVFQIKTSSKNLDIRAIVNEFTASNSNEL